MSKEGTRRQSKPKIVRRYSSPDIPMAAIRRYARQIAERFRPAKIILFGSYAYGQPNEDSDVDLLVIIPARNQLDQAFKIRWQLPAPFAMDLLVITPKEMKWGLDEGESFLTEITSKGKVLYEVMHEFGTNPLVSSSLTLVHSPADAPKLMEDR
jgi:predicted nucleotidyltransferase